MKIVEIVCCSLQDCVDAARSGAGRIELCSTIELGGLTPSIGLLNTAKQFVPLPIMAMLRPRSGGFCYSDFEFETMLADCDVLKQADGFVFGALNPDRTIDEDKCRKLVSAAKAKEKVFHRAFDLVDDPLYSLETLIDLGFTRVLTSGLAPTADDGLETIQLLIENAKGRIEIMPGGGVRAQNVRVILSSGCTSVHLAPLREAVDPTGGSPYRAIDREHVESVVKQVKDY